MIELDQKFHPTDFKELDKEFSRKHEKFLSQEKCLIKKYFGEGIGLATALKKLSEEKLITDAKDFQGIYVFSTNDTPFYVGISQHVIERIGQHVKGKNHFSSSFCYRLGANVYLKEHGVCHEGGRKGLDFLKYVEPTKIQLMNCEVAFYEVEDCLELYLFEVYLAMELGTLYYNTFKTH